MTLRSDPYVRAAILVASLALTQCSAPKPAPPAANYGYDVVVTFTPAALAKIEALNTQPVVDGFYFGMPNSATRDKVNDAGQIELGEDHLAFDPAAKSVHVGGKAVDPVVVQKINGGPMVLIGVYIPPVVYGKAILKCTTFKDSIAKAQAAPVKIACDVAKP